MRFPFSRRRDQIAGKRFLRFSAFTSQAFISTFFIYCLTDICSTGNNWIVIQMTGVKFTVFMDTACKGQYWKLWLNLYVPWQKWVCRNCNILIYTRYIKLIGNKMNHSILHNNYRKNSWKLCPINSERKLDRTCYNNILV